uniref:Pre-mRNA-splicing factor 18 n=1 Tax=Leptocylindrus danicus TaxID=163516 RepID=A0A7S2LMM2_9STRA|mmetsp:Transcript_7122/g.10638  ORF Transcript_7122/g.10638 Transcript_7122/m.10638 type:complete len:379 (+) Transcript_7122:31-1167(+)
MDLLKAEMARKRKTVETLKKQQTSKKSKYIKARELRELEEKQELDQLNNAKTAAAVANRELAAKNDSDVSAVKNTPAKINENGSGGKKVKQSSKSSDQQSSSTSSTKTQSKAKLDSPSIRNIDAKQAIQELRELGLPVRLFAEKDEDRLYRLEEARNAARAVNSSTSEMDEFRLGSGHGIRNPFLGSGKDADDDYNGAKDAKANAVGDPGDDDDDEVDEMDDHKRIYRFFKGLLKGWENELAMRPDAVKRSAKGKVETKTLKQCKDYIRPLFKQCKKRTLPADIMAHIVKIVNFCEAGEFVKAHDSYMDVAIGRAAWPIGVTMVGIHARSGREKIESGKVAHAMNSELQRKYLTSIKRLMTFCQNTRKDVAPSKKVMN